MKTGILGGTFDPVHLGHLILAQEIKEKLGLGRVIFVPAYRAPHKGKSGLLPARHRLNMLRLAVRGNPSFSVSDIELRRRGISYTIDTVNAFGRRYPADELFFIAGSDLVPDLKTWKEYRSLLKAVTFVVAGRPGYPAPGKRVPGVTSVRIRTVDISAAEIRTRRKNGLQVRYFLPEAVYRYIVANRLYI